MECRAKLFGHPPRRVLAAFGLLATSVAFDVLALLGTPTGAASAPGSGGPAGQS